MKYATTLLRNAPPYLVCLVAFGSVVVFGLIKLHGALQQVGLGQ